MEINAIHKKSIDLVMFALKDLNLEDKFCCLLASILYVANTENIGHKSKLRLVSLLSEALVDDPDVNNKL